MTIDEKFVHFSVCLICAGNGIEVVRDDTISVLQIDSDSDSDLQIVTVVSKGKKKKKPEMKVKGEPRNAWTDPGSVTTIDPDPIFPPIHPTGKQEEID
jgi:hypothetical protein